MQSPGRLLIAASAFVAIGLGAAVYASLSDGLGRMPSVAPSFMIFRLALSLAASLFVAWRSAMLGFLLGLFGHLIGWRIAGIYGVDLVTYPLLIGFLLYLLQFCLFARHSLGGDMALPGLGPLAHAPADDMTTRGHATREYGRLAWRLDQADRFRP